MKYLGWISVDEDGKLFVNYLVVEDKMHVYDTRKADNVEHALDLLKKHMQDNMDLYNLYGAK